VLVDDMKLVARAEWMALFVLVALTLLGAL
jgi:hypothetical protein